MKSSATKVLIVDDSVIIGSRIQELLKDFGNIDFIGQAYNIEEGRKVIAKENPGLVILDIGFPGDSGILLIPEIKKRNSGTVVIMFTNYSHILYRNKCLEMGADYFFDKSSEMEMLRELFENHQD